jgi:hypothetical protein
MLMPWPELETKQDIIDLYTDHDRLREALNRIVNYPDKHDCYTPEEMQNIARAALEEGGQDET